MPRQNSRNPLIAAAVRTAASALGKKVLSEVTQAPRKFKRGRKPTASASSSSALIAAPPRVKRAKQAPVNQYYPRPQGRVFRPSCVVPFHVTTVGIATTSSGIPFFYPLSVLSTPTTGQTNIDITPSTIWPASFTGYPMLGAPLLHLARAFGKYRITDFSVEYKPAAATSREGALTVGWDIDPFISSTPNYLSCSTLRDNLDTAVWMPASFRIGTNDVIGKSDAAWRFCNTTQNNEAAQRLVFAGSLVTAGLGLPNSILLGTLSFSGTIEFIDNADISQLSFPNIPAQASLYNSP